MIAIIVGDGVILKQGQRTGDLGVVIKIAADSYYSGGKRYDVQFKDFSVGSYSRHWIELKHGFRGLWEDRVDHVKAYDRAMKGI